MKQYINTGKVKASSSNPDAQTLEFTEIASKGRAIKPLSFYQNELGRLNLKVYEPEVFLLDKPTEEQIQEELEVVAEHKFYKLFGSNRAEVLQYVSDNQRNILEQRENGWKEIKDFFEMIEADKEATENEKYQQEYNKEYKKQEDFIVGETAYVEKSLDEIFNNIRLPFDTSIQVDYNKDKQRATVTVEIPTYIDIPAVKTNVSATYGRVSLKNKLVRELDDEKTKCVIGVAYYISSLVFSTSANIISIDITIWEKGKFDGLLWAFVSRSQFANPKRFAPLVDIFNWNHISNIRLVRGGTHIESTSAEMFRAQINKKREQLGL